jgi:hypothetical protein
VEFHITGAEGGGEQTTARKRGTAARLRPYIEIVRHTQRNIKRWQDGDMRKRWTAAGMLVAERRVRQIVGYRDLAKLVIAIERHTMLVASKNRDRQETCESVTRDHQPVRIATEVPRRSGRPPMSGTVLDRTAGQLVDDGAGIASS